MKQYPPTPILICYLDIDGIETSELESYIERNRNELEHLNQIGWETMLIPVTNASTKIDVAAIDGTFDPIQFEQFKTELYEKLKI